EKADKIAALSGISNSYVNANPQINIAGQGLLTGGDNSQLVADTLKNLYAQLANPSSNPLVVNTRDYMLRNNIFPTVDTSNILPTQQTPNPTFQSPSQIPLSLPMTVPSFNLGGITDFIKSHGIILLILVVIGILIMTAPKKME